MSEVAGQTPHVVAYQLLLGIAVTEGKSLQGTTAGGLFAVADKDWLLNTYIDCLRAVQDLKR